MTRLRKSCVVPGALLNIESLDGDVMSVSVQSSSKKGAVRTFRTLCLPQRNNSYVLEDHVVQR